MVYRFYLTFGSISKWITFLQNVFWNAFPWDKMCEFWFQFQYTLFARDQLTILGTAFWRVPSSSSSNFISNKYMKTSIYNTIALMITAMFTCTLLVATRKGRGLSSWLPKPLSTITWSNIDLLSVGPLQPNFSKTWPELQTFHSRPYILKYRLQNNSHAVPASLF